jgi:hypothetical protein
MKPRKASAAPLDRRLLDDKAAAEFLSSSRSQVRAMVSNGQIPRVVVPSIDGRPLRRLLIDSADLIRLVETTWKQKGEVKT